MVAGFVGGLFYPKWSKGFIVGLLGGFLTWIVLFMSYQLLVPRSLESADLFLSVAGAGGLGFVFIVLALIIGSLGGGIGGLIGSSLNPVISWLKLEKTDS